MTCVLCWLGECEFEFGAKNYGSNFYLHIMLAFLSFKMWEGATMGETMETDGEVKLLPPRNPLFLCGGFTNQQSSTPSTFNS